MGNTKELSNVRDQIVDLHKAGLQDHKQEAWWEGDFCWCDNSKMGKIQNEKSITLGLALWGKDDHGRGEGSAQNNTGVAC